FATRTGLPSPRLVAWYAARAAGGAGLIIVESTLVGGPPAPRRRLRLDDDAAVPRFRRLARAITSAGAHAAIQLPYPPVPDLGALAGAEIAQIVTLFGAAAGRARAAGFDAVEIQASHRSLLAQLLSPATNRRHDRYGRDFNGRVRALVEIVGAVRRAGG